MKTIKDPLAGIGRQAGKLLDAQRTGKFPKVTPGVLARNEIEGLLRDPDAEQKWIEHALHLQLPHAREDMLPDEITTNLLGGASFPSTKRHYLPLVCDLVAATLSAHPELDIPASEMPGNNLNAIIALYKSNKDFSTALHHMVNAKYLDSYVAKRRYGPGLASLPVRGEDVITLISSLDPEASADGLLQFGSIIRVQKAMPDPRHFAEKLLLAAAQRDLACSIGDAVSVAYILYQKRFEYMQAVLDLRQRIGAITGQARESTPVEKAIVATEFSSLQKNILVYGKAKVEQAISTARRLGMLMEQTVYIDPPQANRRAGTITSLRPGNEENKFVVEVTAGGEVLYFDLYRLKNLQVRSTDGAR